MKYHNETKGFNTRLDELQAAFLRVKLPRLDAWNERRKAIAHAYLEALSGAGVVLPYVPGWADPVWHLFAVRSQHRDALQAHLQGCGVNTLVHYPIPPHLQAAYAEQAMREGSLPVAEAMSREVLSLPIGPHMKQEQVRQVIAAISIQPGKQAAR